MNRRDAPFVESLLAFEAHRQLITGRADDIVASQPPIRGARPVPRFLDRPRVRTGGSETELAIYRATEKLLSDYRFDDLSVAQIIEEAGLSRASFYHYFSSKLGVIAGLLVSVMDEMFEIAAPFMLRPGATITESLRMSMQAAIDVWTGHRILLRVVMENWASSEELEAQWCGALDRFAQRIADEIDHERAAGRLPEGLPSIDLAASLVWSTERCLYIAGRAQSVVPAHERAEVEVLVTIWSGTLRLGAAEAR